MMSVPLIVVVDDEIPALRLIRLTLQRAGYEIVTATDGQEALNLIQQRPPDLILADVLMPRLGGFDLVRIVKRDPKLRNIPCILVTSLNRYEDQKMGYQFGADFYITKPFTPEGLLQSVNRALGRGEEQESKPQGK